MQPLLLEPRKAGPPARSGPQLAAVLRVERGDPADAAGVGELRGRQVRGEDGWWFGRGEHVARRVPLRGGGLGEDQLEVALRRLRHEHHAIDVLLPESQYGALRVG